MPGEGSFIFHCRILAVMFVAGVIKVLLLCKMNVKDKNMLFFLNNVLTQGHMILFCSSVCMTRYYFAYENKAGLVLMQFKLFAPGTTFVHPISQRRKKKQKKAGPDISP